MRFTCNSLKLDCGLVIQCWFAGIPFTIGQMVLVISWFACVRSRSQHSSNTNIPKIQIHVDLFDLWSNRLSFKTVNFNLSNFFCSHSKEFISFKIVYLTRQRTKFNCSVCWFANRSHDVLSLNDLAA